MKHEKTFAAIAKLKEIEIELHRLKNALELANKMIDAKKPWVGLTDEEVQKIMRKTVATCSELDDFIGCTATLFWKNCEDKLKEKNGG